MVKNKIYVCIRSVSTSQIAIENSNFNYTLTLTLTLRLFFYCADAYCKTQGALHH